MNTTRINSIGLSLITVVLLGCASNATVARVPSVKATQSLPTPADMNDVRYCEVIPVFRDGVSFNVEVYNTITLNDCPAVLWSQLKSDNLSQQLDAIQHAQASDEKDQKSMTGVSAALVRPGNLGAIQFQDLPP